MDRGADQALRLIIMSRKTPPTPITGAQAMALARQGARVRRESWLEGVYVCRTGYAIRYHNADGKPLQFATAEDFIGGDWIECIPQD
jgi:hypothetical protein